MSTLAVIPARLGATRLPRKPLRLLAGRPLIVRVWERIAAMNVADRCVVATDAAEIVEAVRQAGGECVMTRDDHPSGTDRVAEVARRRDYAGYDTIVNVQGDEPFVATDAIRGAAELVSTSRFPLATAAAPAGEEILDRPHVVKVIAADDGRALYFSRAAIPHLRERDDRTLRQQRIRQHIGVYAYARAALDRWIALPPHPLEQIERLEQLRPLAAGIPMGVAAVAEAPQGGIDTEEDLQRANRQWDDFFARLS